MAGLDPATQQTRVGDSRPSIPILVRVRASKSAEPGGKHMWSKDNDVVRDATLMAPNAYLQLVGIVQALVVGLLLQQGAVFQLIEDSRFELHSAESWLALFQALTAFQIIVLTWHVNLQTVITFQRVLGLADSYIPFSFIFAEYFIVLNSQPARFEGWALSLGVFFVGVVAAYMHLFMTANKDFEENSATLAHIGNYSVIVCVFFLLTAAVAFTGYVIDPIEIRTQALFAGVLAALMLLFTAIHVRLFWRPIIRAQRLKKAL